MVKKLTYEIVYEEIKRRIKEGIWKPNEQIPTVQQLSDEMGVGLSSVREAIRILSMQKILKAEQGRGTFINSGLEDSPSEYFDLLEHASFVQLTQVRQLIEPELAAYAAENATEAEAEEILDLAKTMFSKVSKGQDFFEVDLIFHDRIAKASGNEVFYYIIKMIHDLLVDSRRKSIKLTNLSQEAASSHLLIGRAIKHKKADEARSLMKLHLQHLFDEYNQMNQQSK